VPDGQTALHKMDELADLAPTLIVCDVYMPVMDGATLIQRLRARGVRTPIIALSAGGPPAREAAMLAGADAYLDKPVRLNELLAISRQLLAL
jgi:CheY-like chemotaxis protein